MTITDFYLYLVYGFSMISMGIFAILQKDSKVRDFSLIRSLRYLGFFGIIHGLSEWNTLIIKLELCHPYLITEVYYTNVLLKALSFSFLWHFGLDLLPVRDKHRRILLGIPWLSLTLYMLGFYMLILKFGPDYHFLNRSFNIITIRYFMALPSCLTAAVALYLNARSIEKSNSRKIARRYRNLAWVFIAYGLVEGLLVSKADFFPANVIHTELFPEYFSRMTLFFKAIVGFIINYLLIQVIDTFSWQQEARLLQLEKQRIASGERRKLGLEIHDGIIQELYALGLEIEYLASFHDQASVKLLLEKMKGNVTNTINKIREFISVNALDEIELDKLKDNLEELVGKYTESQNTEIVLKWNIPSYLEGSISPEMTTQLYYIVQEALTNVIKHAQADYAEILLEGGPEFIFVTIVDNGKGISSRDINYKQQLGIRSMKERTQRIHGFIKIESLIKGTRIELKIPWEENYDRSN